MRAETTLQSSHLLGAEEEHAEGGTERNRSSSSPSLLLLPSRSVFYCILDPQMPRARRKKRRKSSRWHFPARRKCRQTGEDRSEAARRKRERRLDNLFLPSFLFHSFGKTRKNTSTQKGRRTIEREKNADARGDLEIQGNRKPKERKGRSGAEEHDEKKRNEKRSREKSWTRKCQPGKKKEEAR